MLEIADDHIDVFDGDAMTDLRGLVHQVGAENAFYRPHQPPIKTIHIRGDGFAAEAACLVFGVIEHCGGDSAETGFEFDQFHGVTIGNGGRGIGSAEVNGAVVVGGHGGGRFPA